jgi:hypothetical protein
LNAPSSLKCDDPKIVAINARGIVCSHIAVVKAQIAVFVESNQQEPHQQWLKLLNIAKDLVAHINNRVTDTHGPRLETKDLVLTSLFAALLQHHQSVDSESPTILWCHQMQVAGGKMDVCGYQRVGNGWTPRVVWEFAVDNTVKDSQLFGYVNNLDHQRDAKTKLLVIGAIVIISQVSTISLKAYYKVNDGNNFKLAVVDLYEGLWDAQSLTKVLHAIQCWLQTDAREFECGTTESDGVNELRIDGRNVLIHDDVVTKVFDYRKREVIPLNRRNHTPSVQYIPNCELVVGEEDLAIIRYPFIAGNHLPASCKQVIGVLRHLMQIHDDGNIHMDIRASNLVFNENGGGSVIDFDFCSPVSDAVYPANYCINIGDGSRDKDVKAGGIGTIGHDCFSLASVLRLCAPDNNDFASHWEEICSLIQNVKLQEALDKICNSSEDYNLSSTAQIPQGPGTGSPPKCSLVADITVQVNHISLVEETS